MAIVQLNSTNPKFSFLIKKNPETGMLLRAVRQGIAYGWYSDEVTFNVYFKDADNDVSFKRDQNETFEYLNVSRYNTPLFPLSAINEFFSSPLKEQDEEGYKHTFFINLIHIERVRYITFFQKHMKDYTITIEQQANKSYSLTVSTEKSLYHLLHTVSVMCLFLSVMGNEYIDISEPVLDKYIRSINVIDAPFFIRSLFARNLLTTRERFKKYKAYIEQTARYEMTLEYGGTATQRRSYISSVLAFDKPILDLGCGEGFYAISYAGKVDGMYYAVDINEELLEVVKRKAESKGIENIVTYNSLDHFLESYSHDTVDVILTEVIEHMSEDEAGAFIRKIFESVTFDRLIITTPNADFNRYYELDGFRHDDHKWEMSKLAFEQWIIRLLQDYPCQYSFAAIGDSVEDIHTTQGIIISKKEE
ncbi:methyltransferase domain-containing protein [Paenibacillus sp. GSMTC-2017]|uniref:class I SAM-dependent methyltransferase n=1 Tax=Paenibacillus sp. GSMTC-2017 TaxID=2794350 RepID=UPI0018D74989|nr:methyltransferase domain-containing protein [Paenibacillus sp. GSMTC-2017]MBH5318560.1 methyltransferase domain-containing protein [Paenibacillus sp. GSMTC-2017]